GTHIVAAGCECSSCDLFGDDTVTVIAAAAPVCAVPVNFRQVGTADLGAGYLWFDYRWDSSTGNLNDLSACSMSEIVDYPGSGATYPFPSPPFPAGPGGIPNDPTIISFFATPGSATDTHGYPSGSFVQPYVASSFTAVQRYRYSCPCHNG